MAYVEDIKQIYSWHPEDGWQVVEAEGQGLALNLYELNKNIISQFEPMDKKSLYNAAGGIIFDFFIKTKPNTHYMLLCREYNYYTIFEPHVKPLSEPESFTDAVLGIVEEIGAVYSIDPADGAIEFWIKPEGCEEPMVFILFPYDQGVVNYA